jgi:hypothetical protein
VPSRPCKPKCRSECPWLVKRKVESAIADDQVSLPFIHTLWQARIETSHCQAYTLTNSSAICVVTSSFNHVWGEINASHVACVSYQLCSNDHIMATATPKIEDS